MPAAVARLHLACPAPRPILIADATECEKASVMLDALKRIHDKGVRFQTVVDVGCADGHFFLELLHRRVAPGAVSLNVDANQIYETSLKDIARAVGGHYRITALADFQGETEMTTASHPYWASLRPQGDRYWERINSLSAEQVKVPVTTLDVLAEQIPLQGPFLLKMDVQGAEEAVLRGASKVLADTYMVICEADLDDFGKIHSTLSNHDFVLYDVTQLNRDPEGGLGWFYPVYLHRRLDHLRARAFWPESANARVIEMQVARRTAMRERVARLLGETRKGAISKTPRNAPCTCGSGRKYKHCCGSFGKE